MAKQQWLIRLSQLRRRKCISEFLCPWQALSFRFQHVISKDSSLVHWSETWIFTKSCSSAGISSCTLSTWLTCRLASSEQQRMFMEREHSLHHSHEMTEKVRRTVAAHDMCVNTLRHQTCLCPIQEVLDSSSNGVPQISYNGHIAASPWRFVTRGHLLTLKQTVTEVPAVRSSLYKPCTLTSGQPGSTSIGTSFLSCFLKEDRQHGDSFCASELLCKRGFTWTLSTQTKARLMVRRQMSASESNPNDFQNTT